MKKFKRHSDYGFWDQDIRLSKLSALGAPLEKLNKGIDFEVFRSVSEDRSSKASKAPGGRPPCDYVLMFRILILQRYYNLPDGRVEYQINDRMSFMRFLDLSIAGDIPGGELWNDQPHKKCQKDIDARRTEKNKASYFGYKNHVRGDGKSKLITKYSVTPAGVHDSRATEEGLLEEQDSGEDLYADSAYAEYKM